MVLGLIGSVVLASGSLIKAISMIILGLLLGQINTDVISGTPRYSFDIPELTDGIDFVVIAMGVFGYGEIIANLSKPEDEREVFAAKVTGLMPTKEDFKHMIPAMLRGTALGSALGILPGGGTMLSAFAAYTMAPPPGRIPRAEPRVSCPVAVPCCRPLLPTRSRRRPSSSRAKSPSVKATSAACALPSRPTTPVRRPPSSRC